MPAHMLGTFESRGLEALVLDGAVSAPGGIPAALVQPASIDLRLGTEAYRMPGSVLPVAGETVEGLARGLALERIDLSQPACLGRDQVYLVRLAESLALPQGLEGYANGKSSTGRVDLATRVLCDGSPRYDRIPAGYHGPLWVELVPRSFPIIAEAGVALTQMIAFRGRQLLDHAALSGRHGVSPLLIEPDGRPSPISALFDGRVVMGADLKRSVVGWVAKRTHVPLVLTRLAAHRAEDFFVPVPRPPTGFLFLEQDRFYILATRERIVVPADLACEMVPYDPTAGDFRAHYAGFFDPGFGLTNGEPTGAVAVLEVRPHQDDLILRHGQPICTMAYERLAATCTRLYGACGNTYAGQDGPKLSKHFAEETA